MQNTYFKKSICFFILFFILYFKVRSQSNRDSIKLCELPLFAFRLPIQTSLSDSSNYLKNNFDINYYLSRNDTTKLMSTSFNVGNLLYIENNNFSYFSYSTKENYVYFNVDENKKLRAITISDSCLYKEIFFDNFGDIEECFICKYDVSELCSRTFFENKKIKKIVYYIPLNFITEQQKIKKNFYDEIYKAFYIYTEYYDNNGNIEYIEKRF